MWEAVLYGSATTASAKRLARAFAKEAGINPSLNRVSDKSGQKGIVEGGSE